MGTSTETLLQRAKELYRDGQHESEEFQTLLQENPALITELNDWIQERIQNAPPSEFDIAGNYVGPFAHLILPPSHYKRKLSMQQEREIAQLLKDPSVTRESIKRSYNITQTIIDRIRRENDLPSRRGF